MAHQLAILTLGGQNPFHTLNSSIWIREAALAQPCRTYSSGCQQQPQAKQHLTSF
jgi:hypothetical protein